jgi:hypothetical protein
MASQFIGVGTTCQVINSSSPYFKELGKIKSRKDEHHWILTIRVPGIELDTWVPQDVDVPYNDVIRYNNYREINDWEISHPLDKPVSGACSCLIL